MNQWAVKDLKSPRKLRERLGREDEILVTNNGRPMAIIINISQDDDPEELARATRDARSRLALTRIREAAARSGAAQMGSEVIDNLIAKTRAERRAGK